MTIPTWYAIFRALEALDEAIAAHHWTNCAHARLEIRNHKTASAQDVQMALSTFRYKYEREPNGDFVWRTTWEQQLQS
ncbi:MAG TPA: hypothetical protein PKW33_00750 [Anaerolineaceae bacterium]|nr:hypothetical protein [Anaerolineaceae bacterium]HPN50086.1 hypothetical protein [Anaerolineaceae bacterium]